MYSHFSRGHEPTTHVLVTRVERQKIHNPTAPGPPRSAFVHVGSPVKICTDMNEAARQFFHTKVFTSKYSTSTPIFSAMKPHIPHGWDSSPWAVHHLVIGIFVVVCARLVRQCLDLRNFCTKIALSASHCARSIIMQSLIAANGTKTLWHSVLRFTQRCIWRFCCSGIWRCVIMSGRFEPA